MCPLFILQHGCLGLAFVSALETGMNPRTKLVAASRNLGGYQEPTDTLKSRAALALFPLRSLSERQKFRLWLHLPALVPFLF